MECTDVGYAHQLPRRALPLLGPEYVWHLHGPGSDERWHDVHRSGLGSFVQFVLRLPHHGQSGNDNSRASGARRVCGARRTRVAHRNGGQRISNRHVDRADDLACPDNRCLPVGDVLGRMLECQPDVDDPAYDRCHATHRDRRRTGERHELHLPNLRLERFWLEPDANGNRCSKGAPSLPRNLLATVGDQRVTLDWTAPTNLGGEPCSATRSSTRPRPLTAARQLCRRSPTRPRRVSS